MNLYARDVTERSGPRKSCTREIAAARFQRAPATGRARVPSTRDLVRDGGRLSSRRSPGCEAVGIRLKDGDDYPYYEARGFPQEFVRLENQLCARDEPGRSSATAPAIRFASACAAT